MDEMEIQLEEERYLKWKSERQHRFRIVMSVAPVIVGIVAIIYSTMTVVDNDIEYILTQASNIIGPVSFLISGVAVLMIYLQTGFKRKADEEINYIKYENEINKLRSRIENSATINTSDIENIQEQLAALNKRIDQASSMNEVIATEHKEELVSLLKSEILKSSTDEAFKDTLEKLKKEVCSSNQLKEVENVFLKTLDRLYTEISSLTRRGNLNLSLGIFTTIIGLTILGYFVLEIDSIPEDKMAFIAHFIPRLSLVLLIEVFAYFFLKLYKSSLSEIKYFQNEMTNTEAKLVALKCSIMTCDESTTSQVIQTLTNTERNAILEKGQTTAEIEKSKIEQQNISTISDKVSNLIGAKKSA